MSKAGDNFAADSGVAHPVHNKTRIRVAIVCRGQHTVGINGTATGRNARRLF